MTSQPEHPRCSLALHKKVLQYSPSIVQGRSPILHQFSCKLIKCLAFELPSVFTHMIYAYLSENFESHELSRRQSFDGELKFITLYHTH